MHYRACDALANASLPGSIVSNHPRGFLSLGCLSASNTAASIAELGKHFATILFHPPQKDVITLIIDEPFSSKARASGSP